MFNLIKFITPRYLFVLQPTMLNPKTKIFLMVVFGVLLILGIVFVILAKVKKRDIFLARVLKKFYILFFVLSILGWVLLFFRIEKVYLFSGRFWLLAWFLTLVIWLILVIHYALHKMPQQKEKAIKEQEFEKYLPRKNK